VLLRAGWNPTTTGRRRTWNLVKMECAVICSVYGRVSLVHHRHILQTPHTRFSMCALLHVYVNIFFLKIMLMLDDRVAGLKALPRSGKGNHMQRAQHLSLALLLS
jgi:hypothetical protein